MATSLTCECGFVADGDDDDSFVLTAREHARTAHGVEVTAETLLARAAAERNAADQQP